MLKNLATIVLFLTSLASANLSIKNKSLRTIKKGEVERSDNVQNLKSGDKIIFKFDVVDENNSKTQVQQAMIRLFTEKNGREAFVLAKAGKSGAGSYTGQLNLATEFTTTLGGQAGSWDSEIILGDSKSMGKVENLGKFSIAIDGKAKSTQSDKTAKIFSPDKLVEHTFRVPDKRPPALVSIVFTGLVLSPLVLLFTLWPIYGLNFKLYSFSVSGVVFHAALTLTIGLYIVYWLQLTMFTTLHYLMILSPVMVFSGHRALSALALKRKSVEESGDKKDN